MKKEVFDVWASEFPIDSKEYSILGTINVIGDPTRERADRKDKHYEITVRQISKVVKKRKKKDPRVVYAKRFDRSYRADWRR